MGKGIAIGLREKRGVPVQKRELKAKPSARKGRLNKRKALARAVIREVAGFAPYEKRIMELLRNSLDKRALRLAKRKLGTHQRAKRKRDELGNVLTAQKLAASKAEAAE
eukprot:TRINITY_DN2407_c0_g1_i1.p1 TRINITY_DN2407_c0_g1~~TRINITY_DN2407_c0_g1_i1.p1  ORF type:complete len:116 (+),score=41.22 TRINITY_DN2407_c0_g1_i1:23-349(+)